MPFYEKIILINIQGDTMTSKTTASSDQQKQKALEVALGAIEKQFGKGAIMKLDEDGARTERILQSPLVVSA